MDIFLPYQEFGVDYIVAILKGYGQKPAGMTMPADMQYNELLPWPRDRHARRR